MPDIMARKVRNEHCFEVVYFNANPGESENVAGLNLVLLEIKKIAC